MPFTTTYSPIRHAPATARTQLATTDRFMSAIFSPAVKIRLFNELQFIIVEYFCKSKNNLLYV